MPKKEFTKKIVDEQISPYNAAQIIFGNDLQSVGFPRDPHGHFEIALLKEQYPKAGSLLKFGLPKKVLKLAEKQNRDDRISGEPDGCVYYEITPQALIHAAEKKQSRIVKS